MCWFRHTIQLKCTRSHPMMNSSLRPYNQLHQPRLCMHLSIQATLIHQVRNDITIIRSKINQNGNKLIMKLTFHLNNGCLMTCLIVIHCCINPRNTLMNISNCLCLLPSWCDAHSLFRCSPPQVQHLKGFLPSPLFYFSGWNPCPMSIALNFL